MTKVLIQEGYRVNLPTKAQKVAPIGTELVVMVDRAGRIILTPEAHIRSILLETFGMWSEHKDAPKDGVGYVDQIRQGQRLDHFGFTTDEAH